MKKLTAILTILACTGLFGGSAPAYELGGVDIHGFASQGFIISDQYNYLTHNSKEGSFEYNEFGINFSSDLTENLRLGLQLFSRDLGDVANNKVTLDWAYGDYRLRDWFGIRAGRIKLPLGLYNEIRDIDMLRTSIVMPQGIYPDLLRDTIIAANGAGLYGNIPIGALGSLDYQGVVGAINVDNDSGFEKWYNSEFSQQGLTLNGDIDNDIAWCGNIRWNTPLEGLIFGASALSLDSDVPVVYAGLLALNQETATKQYVFSTEYTWNDLVLAAEYQIFDTESTTAGIGTENTSIAYYLSASYRVNELLTVGAYYLESYENEDDKDGNTFANRSDAWEKDFALSLRFDINDYIVFKVEGHKVDGTARVNKTDNTDRTEDDFYYGLAKITFSF